MFLKNCFACLNDFTSLFTSSIFVPLPWAMRLRLGYDEFTFFDSFIEGHRLNDRFDFKKLFFIKIQVFRICPIPGSMPSKLLIDPIFLTI